ncbi:GtrA family protein [Gammaproteobacteria bacterium]|nr:GtrA family protein [Gammaproteobacteria bacterium]
MNSFLRFCVIGIFSTLVNYASYIFLLTNEISIFFSSIIGYSLGTFVSYHFGRTWVFHKQSKSNYYDLIKFLTVYLFNGVIVAGITSVLSDVVGFDYRVSWLLGVIYGMFANFLGSKFLVFKKE